MLGVLGDWGIVLMPATELRCLKGALMRRLRRVVCFCFGADAALESDSEEKMADLWRVKKREDLRNMEVDRGLCRGGEGMGSVVTMG